jgi:hypothetical protein
MNRSDWWNNPVALPIPTEKGEGREIDWRGLKELVTYFLTVFFFALVFLYLANLGRVVIFEEPCIKTDIRETSDGIISYPHERNQKGCIVDFNRRINTEPIIQ